MLSDSLLSSNLSAAARALGATPALAPADRAAIKLTASGGRLYADRKRDGEWRRVPTLPRDALAGLDAPGIRTICILCPGLGDVVEALPPSGTQRVVLIEPDPALATLMLARRDWTAWFDAGMQLLVGPDYPGATASAGRLDVTIEPSVLELPREAAELTSARAVLGRLLAGARANLAARRRFAPRYLTQTLANLPIIEREGDAGDLAGRFVNVPAVIVGAGPSLDDTLDAVADASRRAIVIASDTTLRPLRTAGMHPPLAVGVDPGDANARHLVGLAPIDDTWLVAEGALHPSAFEDFRGRTFLFHVSNHEPWPWLETCGAGRARLLAWGSVVTSAMDLALALGCNPIVFAGVDLAFTGGRTYCRGTAHEAVWGQWIANGHTWREVWDALMAQWPDVRETDVHGAPVRTAPHLVAFRDWLVEQSRVRGDVRVVNATGAGILHGGCVEQLTLEQALRDAPPLDPSAVASTLRDAHNARRSVTLGPPARAVAEEAAAGTPGPVTSRWLDFAGGGVTLDQIASTLTSAVPALRG